MFKHKHEVIKHSDKMPPNFTGIVYSDVGKNGWAPVVNGQFIKRADGKNRWFASEAAAGKALDTAKP